MVRGILRACARVLLVSSAVVVPPVSAAQIEVPPALEAWRGWVLQDEAQRNCPLLAGQDGTNTDDFLCAWPGTLDLRVAAESAEFSQRWRVDAESWVPLPGDEDHWPQDVTLDGLPAVVVAHDGQPAVRLMPGGHVLRGRLLWRSRPATLNLPPELGLVALSVDGRTLAPVQRDGDAVLLGQRGGAAPQADSVQLRVYRKLADGLPALLTTRIELQASGQAREEVFGPVLPEGFVPQQLDGDWPARLDADGRLRVRVAPGQAALELTARAIAPLAQVTAGHAPAPWPQQEIWSYAANPRQRVTVASGAVPVDPAQAQIPADWRALPGFAIDPGASLMIEERSRGIDPDEGNRLRLEREMWLDFDGKGYFARDRLSGAMRQGWRLDVAPPYVLQRADALADRSGLLVTQGAGNGRTGVEWRNAVVALEAGLRIERRSSLPIAGWQDSFDSVGTTLHLPNGYLLLGAPGAETSRGSWIARWTLLDVFAASILLLMAWRALGRAGGLALLGALLLGFQEAGLPQWSLFWALALSLIVRELPEGRLVVVCRWARNAALVVLLLVALPFVAAQVRMAIYPQLEPSDDGYEWAPPTLQAPIVFDAQMPMSAPEPAPMLGSPREDARAGGRSEESLALDSITVSGSRMAGKSSITVSGSRMAGKSPKARRYSESAVVQTGPGEPAWTQGHRYALGWNGPVLPAQEVQLVILPPWLLRPLRLILVVLLAGALFLLLRNTRQRRAVASVPRTTFGTLFLVLLVLPILGVPNVTMAQTLPSPELLDALHARLTRAPDCAPDCVALARADLRVQGNVLSLMLEVHAAERVAMPLPSDARALGLRSLRIDGIEGDLIAVHDEEWWVALARGVHRLELALDIGADQVALDFPLQPARVSFTGDGWEASGLDEDRLQTETLSLVRARPTGDDTVRSDGQQFEPYARVTRTLHLDLDWSVDTHLQRIAPQQGGVTFEVPLLVGEHVTTPGMKVNRERVSAALAGDQIVLDWSSSLDRSEVIRLVAPALGERAEVWRVQVGSSWHLAFSGVPESASGEQGEHVFEFQPLPGETLELSLLRPEATRGDARAIDAVRLTTGLGQRATRLDLELTIRASQGGEHPLVLPEGFELLSVKRNQEAINLRQQDGRLSLPLTPGTQTFELGLRNGAGLGLRSVTPTFDLGLPAANISLDMELPQDRWLLATRGPTVGPAVLYWGELLVMLLVAVALARLPRSPLRLHQWLLLGIGFSASSWIALLIVVAWLFAIEWRGRVTLTSRWLFDLGQLAYAVLSLIVLFVLFLSIKEGLLGQPDMHVVGADSWGGRLGWFADRSASVLPTAEIFTLPIWVYRVAMLAWAMWLASALLGWLRRAFSAWMHEGYWRPLFKRRAVAAQATADVATASSGEATVTPPSGGSD